MYRVLRLLGCGILLLTSAAFGSDNQSHDHLRAQATELPLAEAVNAYRSLLEARQFQASTVMLAALAPRLQAYPEAIDTQQQTLMIKLAVSARQRDFWIHFVQHEVCRLFGQ